MEAKPCPFCGGTDITTGELNLVAKCVDCDTRGPWPGPGIDDDALAAWNRRAPEKPERKARPDAVGWWWICDEDDATGMYEVVRTGPGALIALGVCFSFNVASRSIRWAVGPIEPPSDEVTR